MANKITTTVFDNCGNTYATDVYVKHDAIISTNILNNLNVRVDLAFYKNESSFGVGFSPFIPVSSLELTREFYNCYQQILTPEQASTFSAAILQSLVTTKLKEWYGAENVLEV